MNRERVYTFAGAVALIVLALLVYGSTLSAGFVYDDNFQIVRNPWIRSYAFLDDIFTSHSFAFTKESYQAISYRPLVFLIFMAEYAAFGLMPWGWHLVSIALHGVNGVLVFLLARKLLSGRAKTYSVMTAAIVSAAFFITLPVNSEVPSWVGCIPELVYTGFSLAAFYAFLLSRERGGSYLFTALSLACYGFAMLTKETAIMFPAFMLAYEAAEDRQARFITAKRILNYISYALTTLVFLSVRFYAIGNITPSEKIDTTLTGFQYFINAFPLFLKYLRSLVLPINNLPLQMLDPVFSIAEPKAFLSIAVIIFMACLLFLFRKKFSPVHALSLALIIMPLLPVLYMPAVSRTPFADRYLYLPAAGLAILMADFLIRMDAKGKAAVFTAILVVIMAVNGAWANKRSRVWNNERSLWETAAAGSEDNYVAIHSVGLLYIQEGMVDEGVLRLKTALSANLKSRNPDPTVLVLTHKVLGMAYHKKGLLDEAVREYNEVLRLSPEDKVANFNLGAVFQEKGFYTDAVEHYKVALLFTQEPAQRKDILRNLGSAYMSLGLKNEALASYDEALALAPGDPAILSAVQMAREGR